MGDSEKIIFITAGGAGMYCGSCMRDNTLVRHLRADGWNVELVPLYTPIRTDEEDVSVDRVFLGGINVYLRQNVPGFRFLPSWMLSWLDRPDLIRKATSGQVKVDGSQLGPLTLSVLSGESGALRQEHRRFAKWLAKENPALINLTNLLIGGAIPLIRKQLPKTPILVTLQGDDLFLDSLIDPWRTSVIDRMRVLAEEVDQFVTFSKDYASRMADLLQIPEHRFAVVPLGIELPPPPAPEGKQIRNEVPVIGYFARISPEKGFHHAVDAFVELAQTAGMEKVRFRAGGWLSAHDQSFFDTQQEKLRKAGLLDRFSYEGSPDGPGKWTFLSELDLFSVPTDFLEPKGMYVLEALAAGVPVVQPHHGSFPELLADCAQATLVPPKDPQKLAAAWVESLQRDSTDPLSSHDFVRQRATAQHMAEATGKLYRKALA